MGRKENELTIDAHARVRYKTPLALHFAVP